MNSNPNRVLSSDGWNRSRKVMNCEWEGILALKCSVEQKSAIQHLPLTVPSFPLICVCGQDNTRETWNANCSNATIWSVSLIPNTIHANDRLVSKCSIYSQGKPHTCVWLTWETWKKKAFNVQNWAACCHLFSLILLQISWKQCEAIYLKLELV